MRRCLDCYIIASVFLVKGGNKVFRWLGDNFRDFDVCGKYHSKVFLRSISFIKINDHEYASQVREIHIILFFFTLFILLYSFIYLYYY